jgi:hypothetical protein
LIAIGRSRRIRWLCVANNRERFCDLLNELANYAEVSADRSSSPHIPIAGRNGGAVLFP